METLRRFARALALCCPRCGRRGVLRSWFRMAPACPHCGLATDRGESGYQVGSYLFAMMAIEILFAALLVGVIVMTWPTPPWSTLTWAGPLLMLLGPLLLFPFTKTIYLAFDLTFRPEV